MHSLGNQAQPRRKQLAHSRPKGAEPGHWRQSVLVK